MMANSSRHTYENDAVFFQENEGSQASSGEPKASLGLEFEDLSIFEKGMDTSSPNYTSEISILVPFVVSIRISSYALVKGSFILERKRFLSLIFAAAAVAVIQIHRLKTMQEVGSDATFAFVLI